MGDKSILNRNKSNATQTGVFNLFEKTQSNRAAKTNANKAKYVQPAKANYTGSVAGASSFFTKEPLKQAKRVSTPSKISGSKIDPVYTITPVRPVIGSSSAKKASKAKAPSKSQTTTATKQAAVNVVRPAKLELSKMTKFRQYAL